MASKLVNKCFYFVRNIYLENRERYSLLIQKEINIENFDLNKINVFQDSHTQNGGEDWWIDDQIAFSDSKNMDIYMTAYDNLDHLCRQTSYITGESIVGLNIKNNNIEINKDKSIQLRCSLLTALISLETALILNKGSIKNLEKISTILFKLSFRTLK